MKVGSIMGRELLREFIFIRQIKKDMQLDHPDNGLQSKLLHWPRTGFRHGRHQLLDKYGGWLDDVWGKEGRVGKRGIISR